MKGKIVYKFKTPIYPANILYVNLIGNYKCINNCRFCSRPRTKKDIGKPNIYEKKANSFLYLKKSPSVKEVMNSIDKEVNNDVEEIAIIGLGEPLIYFPKVVQLIKKIKERYKVKVRIDTNGLVKFLFKNPAKQLRESGLDEIRISVNATNEEDYQKLCRPPYKNAFKKIVEFIKDCLKERIDTRISFIIGFKDREVKTLSKKEYLKFARSIGMKNKKVIFRDYVQRLGWKKRKSSERR